MFVPNAQIFNECEEKKDDTLADLATPKAKPYDDIAARFGRDLQKSQFRKSVLSHKDISANLDSLKPSLSKTVLASPLTTMSGEETHSMTPTDQPLHSGFNPSAMINSLPLIADTKSTPHMLESTSSNVTPLAQESSESLDVGLMLISLHRMLTNLSEMVQTKFSTLEALMEDLTESEFD